MRKTNLLTVHLMSDTLEHVNYLHEQGMNISAIVRKAIRERYEEQKGLETRRINVKASIPSIGKHKVNFHGAK